MGKYTRKCSKGCSGGGEVAVMEVVQAGVRTRGRAMAVEEAADNSGSAKRRKVDNGELRLSSSKSERIKAREDILTVSKIFGDSAPEKDDLSDPCADARSLSSGDVPASCCSSNGSITEKLKCADLEERAEIVTTVRFNLDRRESTPTSEFKEESSELESSTTAKPSVRIDSRRAIIPVEKMPPAAELEEFFASAEKDLHKSFKDKYNYDIVNDVPMKGRFEWVQLKP
ncbi:cyclin-dependent kinase inhibitor 7-like [Cynara cardunculus var. scolymus]|uniref:Cyclin-dependent kinase inhibitor n=1 Tax=Cynara cardunculus var. scolymus TaxID=59895 RepID=A0A118JV06_CYNCS|nr:cyclin-dependent kinase inhibitor 7-like [Cynara cardunculus var. scolymus]KVH92532.1 Cyclin-dependent kinase inhibitor [Cynara cardunculus var. scolymus]